LNVPRYPVDVDVHIIYYLWIYYMNDKEIDNLYNTNTFNELTVASAKLLVKHKNNRSMTVKIMNRYKDHKNLLGRGMHRVRVYSMVPGKNKLGEMGSIVIKGSKSVANHIRTERRTSSKNLNLRISATTIVSPKRTFTFLGRKVKDFIIVPPQLDLDLTKEYAKFIIKQLDDIKIKFTALTADYGGVIFI